MNATSYTEQAAMMAATCRSGRMPFAMFTACMSATASIYLIGTGVSAPVSLFILFILLVVLLVSFVVLISLVLTGLTGLIRLESLVGLTRKIATDAIQGD